MAVRHLLINEIFSSIQGESTWTGLPCTFVRLRGCSLRCHYCDTSYAFNGGDKMSIEHIIKRVQELKNPLVEITGGEPLLQANVHQLMEELCDRGLKVLLETSGERNIQHCDSRVIRIVDIKTPNSGAAESFLQTNYEHLNKSDEVKFVITNREDFDWSIQVIRERGLCAKVNAVHFSPVMHQSANEEIDGCDALPADVLAQWILGCGESIRLQLQTHRYIWSPNARGV